MKTHTARVVIEITARSKQRAREQAEVIESMIERAVQHESDFDLDARKGEEYALGVECEDDPGHVRARRRNQNHK